jgi:hypothetical protein
MTAPSPGRAGLALGLATALAVTKVSAAPPASLAPAERVVLTNGGRVERPLDTITGDGHSYVGGLSYQVVRSTPGEVITALLDVERLPEILPRTREARLVTSKRGFARIELVQGQGLFVARYTIVLERTRPEELRFWIDPGAGNDIRDVWGFFRAEPWNGDQSLVTVAALVDLGGGPFHGLFADRVQAVVLRSVTGIRDFLEPERVARVGYARCPSCPIRH